MSRAGPLVWTGNFRDLNAAVVRDGGPWPRRRPAYLSRSFEEEIERLQTSWDDYRLNNREVCCQRYWIALRATR